MADGTHCRVPEALGGHEDDHLTEGSAAAAEDLGTNSVHSSQRVSHRPRMLTAAATHRPHSSCWPSTPGLPTDTHVTLPAGSTSKLRKPRPRKETLKSSGPSHSKAVCGRGCTGPFCGQRQPHLERALSTRRETGLRGQLSRYPSTRQRQNRRASKFLVSLQPAVRMEALTGTLAPDTSRLTVYSQMHPPNTGTHTLKHQDTLGKTHTHEHFTYSP